MFELSYFDMYLLILFAFLIAKFQMFMGLVTDPEILSILDQKANSQKSSWRRPVLITLRLLLSPIYVPLALLYQTPKAYRSVSNLLNHQRNTNGN